MRYEPMNKDDGCLILGTDVNENAFMIPVDEDSK